MGPFRTLVGAFPILLAMCTHPAACGEKHIFEELQVGLNTGFPPDCLVAVAVSRDGTVVLTGSSWKDPAILWGMAEGKKLHELQVNENRITSVALSGDGTKALAGSREKMAILWDVAEGKKLQELVGHKDGITSVALTANGDKALTGSADKTAILWDTASARQLHTFAGYGTGVEKVALSGDGTRALIRADATVTLWHTGTMKKLAVFKSADGAAMTEDGKKLAIAREREAVLWDARSGKELLRCSAPDRIIQITLSSDGSRMLTGCEDGTVEVWSAVKGTKLCRLWGQTNGIIGMAQTGDGKHVWMVSGDRTLGFWDAVTGRLLCRLMVFYPGSGRPGGRGWVAFTPEGVFDGSPGISKMASYEAAEWGGVVRFRPVPVDALPERYHQPGLLAVLARGECPRPTCVGAAPIEVGGFERTLRRVAVAMNPEGTMALTGSWKDKTARLWATATGTQLRVFEGHTAAVLSVALSADGTKVLTGSGDGKAIVWNVHTGKRQCVLARRTAAVNGVALSADGSKALTGADDKIAILWNAASGVPVQRFQGHTGPVRGVALSPGGEHVLTGSEDMTAALWDAATGKKLRSFDAHAASVVSVALSADATKAVTGSEDKTAILWDTATGEKLRVLKHSSSVDAVALSADGARLVTGAGNSMILWDTATGKEERGLYFRYVVRRILYDLVDECITSVAIPADASVVLTGGLWGGASLSDAAIGHRLRVLATAP